MGAQPEPDRPGDQRDNRRHVLADDQVVDAIPDMMHADHILRYEREITRELNRLLEEFLRLQRRRKKEEARRPPAATRRLAESSGR